MKPGIIHMLFASVAMMMAFQLNAAVKVVSTEIEKSNISLRGDPVVLATVEIVADEIGIIIVDFDGVCISSPGDGIRVAASNGTSIGINDWGLTFQAYDADVNRNNFSHTRSYDVKAGTYTLYALGVNSGQQLGDGKASIYGKLVAKFFPYTGSGFAIHEGINKTNINIRGQAVSFGDIIIKPETPFDGKFFVKFNGYCVGSPGDRDVLAASDHVGWLPNDGNTHIEAINDDLLRIPFIHTRVYPSLPVVNEFYAVGQNYVEQDGSGLASVYGSLLLMYFPDNQTMLLEHEDIASANIDVRGNPVTVGSLTIDPVVNGVAVVTFNGSCASASGDRIVLAASDDGNWGPNTGATAVEAIDADLNSNNFSHTMIYDVEAGSHTFYAIAQNYVEMDGSGIISIYGSLNVEFYPIGNVGVETPQTQSLEKLIHPNPASGAIQIDLSSFGREKVNIDVISFLGRKVLQTEANGGESMEVDISAIPAGTYIVLVKGEKSAPRVQKLTVL
ncbi:MAG: T9SS type A sorting domain-containing protein [Lentimicrobium sp.]|nr:T9SS type A sorting domain-containing protein [Lentimicrobium sp.]